MGGVAPRKWHERRRRPLYRHLDSGGGVEDNGEIIDLRVTVSTDRAPAVGSWRKKSHHVEGVLSGGRDTATMSENRESSRRPLLFSPLQVGSTQTTFLVSTCPALVVESCGVTACQLLRARPTFRLIDTWRTT